MTRSIGPELSVILATPDPYETLRRTVVSLREQTIKDRLGVVIVAPSSAGLERGLSGLAAEREGSSWPRRLLHALGVPRILPVRMWRIVRRAPARRELLDALPMLMRGLILDGVGQLAGYLAGAGRSREIPPGFECHRASHNAR